MDIEKWFAVRGVLFGSLLAIAALIGGTVYAVFDQARVHYHAAVDRCHDAGGAWVASGQNSYSGQCLRTASTPAWPPVTPPVRTGP